MRLSNAETALLEKWPRSADTLSPQLPATNRKRPSSTADTTIRSRWFRHLARPLLKVNAPAAEEVAVGRERAAVAADEALQLRRRRKTSSAPRWISFTSRISLRRSTTPIRIART